MKVVVIGLGSMGKRRIRLLKNMFPQILVVGVDNNRERMLSVSDEYKISCYISLADIKEEVNYAFVCTSPQTHGVIIDECLKRGLHVFSEINLIKNFYESNIQLAKKMNKILFLSSTSLYKEEIRIIEERVKHSGMVCGYQYHVGQYLPDWHPWDNLSDFFVSHKKTNGCRELLAIELPWIQSVFGKIENINVIKRKLTNFELDFPDIFLVQIEHENGNVGNLMVDIISRQAVRRLEVISQNLYIQWNGTPDSLFEKDIFSGEFKQVDAGEYIHEAGYAESINEYAYVKEIENFFDVVKGGEALYSFEEDLKTLELLDQIEDV